MLGSVLGSDQTALGRVLLELMVQRETHPRTVNRIIQTGKQEKCSGGKKQGQMMATRVGTGFGLGSQRPA